MQLMCMSLDCERKLQYRNWEPSSRECRFMQTLHTKGGNQTCILFALRRVLQNRVAHKHIINKLQKNNVFFLEDFNAFFLSINLVRQWVKLNYVPANWGSVRLLLHKRCFFSLSYVHGGKFDAVTKDSTQLGCCSTPHSGRFESILSHLAAAVWVRPFWKGDASATRTLQVGWSSNNKPHQVWQWVESLCCARQKVGHARTS